MEASRGPASALHGVLLLALFTASLVGFHSLAWPWYLLAPLAVYAAIVVVVPALRRSAPRIALGRMGGAPLACTILLSAASAAVLLAYDAAVRPETGEIAAHVPATLLGSTILSGIVFSVVNAALEEIAIRGILWEVVAAERGAGVALAVTSILFGLLHLKGYPPGPLGALLAGLFGLALGLLRWWTGGLGLAIGCHICADATIFWLLRERSA